MMLDCGAPGMFEATVPDPDYPEDMISPFDYALQAAEQTVRAKIRATVTLRTGQRDAFGILLYNTCYRTPVIDESSTTTTTLKTDEDEEEEEPFAKIQHEFLPLQPPGVSTVQKIRQALDDAFLGRQRDLQKEYQPKPTEDNKLQTDPLQTALFEAGQIFGSCKYVRKVKAGDIEDSKQIWIFTTNDNPCEAEALPVVQQAFEDAKDNGIEIVVWPLPRKTPFDYSLFYDKVQATTPLRNSDSSEATLEELLGDMLRSWKKYRRAFPVPLLLPDWRTNQDRPGIALDVYRLIQVGRRPVNLPIHQQTGR